MKYPRKQKLWRRRTSRTKTKGGVKVYPLDAYRLVFVFCVVILLVSLFFASRIQEKQS